MLVIKLLFLCKMIYWQISLLHLGGPSAVEWSKRSSAVVLVCILPHQPAEIWMFLSLHTNSQSLKIVASHSAPISVHLLTHCGPIFDYGGVLSPQVVPPVAICGLYPPSSA